MSGEDHKVDFLDERRGYCLPSTRSGRLGLATSRSVQSSCVVAAAVSHSTWPRWLHKQHSLQERPDRTS